MELWHPRAQRIEPAIAKTRRRRQHHDRPAGRVAPVTANIRGGYVQAWVRAFADAVAEATGADSFGTYPGHDPSEDLAVDCFVPVDSRTLGDAIASFAIAHIDRYAIHYLIYRQRIYNPSIATYWRDMEDRGSPTQNHYDHVHLSFWPDAPQPQPSQPKPPDPPKRKKAPDMFLFNHGGGVWLHCGDSTLTLLSTPQVESLLTAGVPSIGDVTDDQFAQITGRKPAAPTA